jgi:hypothetical protein
MLLGVWVMLVPLFLGFPGSWNGPILVVTGILIVFIAYRSEPTSSTKEPAVSADAPYAEHRSEPAPASPDVALQDMIPPAAPPVPPPVPPFIPPASPIIDANAETAP